MSSDFDTYSARFKYLMQPDESREGRRKISLGFPGTITKDLPDDAPEFAYVGKIAIEWAILEAKIDSKIRALDPNKNRLSISLRPRLQELEKAYRLAGRHDIADRVKDFTQYACDLGKERNRFIHDYWYMHYNNAGPSRIVRKDTSENSTIGVDEKEFTVDDFETMIYKIRRLTDIFENYIVLESDPTQPSNIGRST